MSTPFRALVAAASLLALSLVPLAPHAVGTARAAGKTAGNLLQNGDFERTLAGHAWMPAGWDTSLADLPTVFFGRDSFLVHGGHWSVNVANMSTAFPMGHNWSQTLIVGREAWGKLATLKVWSRSNGVEGRAFILMQAYSDTASKMARIWGTDHDEALRRLGIGKLDDPLLDLAWKRVWFDDPMGDWVEREAKFTVPEGTNVLFVRCGLVGTGQVLFDDASLTLTSAPPPPRWAKGQNMFLDPSFEQRAMVWDIALPPYEGAKVTADSTVAHTGRWSVRLSDFWDGLVEARIGVAQPFDARSLRGQRLRLTAWFKADSLHGSAYVKIYSQGLKSRVKQSPGAELLSGTFDWQPASIELDVADDALEVWADIQAAAPAHGTVWIDDASLEIVGPALKPATKPATGGAKKAKQ